MTTRLIYNRVLPAATGSYALTGNAANFTLTAADTTPLLDRLTTQPVVSVSNRKVRAAYTGYCIRVRNNAGTLLDIGFDVDGNLDTTALLAHTGTNGVLSQGRVNTWYDQSGNGNNLVAPGTSNEPAIVVDGVLQTSNSKPVVWLGTAGSGYCLRTGLTAVSISGTNAMMVGVLNRGAPDFSPRPAGGFRGNGDVEDMISNSTSALFFTRESNHGYNNATLRNSTATLVEWDSFAAGDILQNWRVWFDGTNCNMSIDGGTAHTGANSDAFASTGAVQIGHTTQGAHRFYYGEMHFFNTVPGSTDRGLLYSNPKLYWGTT